MAFLPRLDHKASRFKIALLQMKRSIFNISLLTVALDARPMSPNIQILTMIDQCMLLYSKLVHVQVGSVKEVYPRLIIIYIDTDCLCTLASQISHLKFLIDFLRRRRVKICVCVSDVMRRNKMRQ